MNTRKLLALALDPSRILAARGLCVDAWQREVLLSSRRQLLLNCCRQAGKSTVVSALALHQALFQPGSLTLIVSPGQRQSAETFKKVRDNYRALGRPIKATHETQLRLELANGSRILCLPGVEETIRCYSPALVIIDEAARVPDDLYRAIRPMLAVSRGRLIALSTPFGQRGWFHDEWHGSGPWQRIGVPWRDCPRISAEFLAEEERAMGRAWVAQEYECSFAAQAGLVYPDFDLALIHDSDVRRGSPDPAGQRVGGIDWGWRNPFAAVWGVLDCDDVLWIQDERYLRETALHEHARALPRGVLSYADPAGRTEIEEFRLAGHVVRRGMNDIRLGIAAVAARLRTGRLKVDPRRCPSLCAEAKLYRYPSEAERALLGENPIDAHNHALAALRYLIARLDARFIARLRQGTHLAPQHETHHRTERDEYTELLHNEAVWETLS
jgi:Terminase large subunit, T4likevirus-type, N-terminal